MDQGRALYAESTLHGHGTRRTAADEELQSHDQILLLGTRVQLDSAQNLLKQAAASN